MLELKQMSHLSALFSFMATVGCSACGGAVQTPSSSVDPAEGAGSEEGEEGDVETLFVGPALVSCEGEGPMWCTQTRATPEGPWELLYDPIEGFTQEVGTTYQLRVRREHVANPMADASSIRIVHVETVSQEPQRAANTSDQDCAGQAIRLTPRIVTTRVETTTRRALTLGLTFCDDSTVDFAIVTGSSAWVLPWWSRVDVDPEAEAAGALFWAASQGRHRMQTVVRVIPREGFISINQAIRPWSATPEGPRGEGPLEFLETNRIHLPASSTVELVRGD